MEIIKRGEWPQPKPTYKGSCFTCKSIIIADYNEVNILITGISANCPVCNNIFLLTEISTYPPNVTIKRD